MKYNILFPVLNEERRIERGIKKTVDFMEKYFKGIYKITVVDNGSIDKTEEIMNKLVKEYNTVNYLRLNEKGVGIAFREGVKRNSCDIVGYMDIDLSTKLEHLLEVKNIFETNEDIKIVNGSRNSKESNVIGRKLKRSITSHGLKWILKIVLGMKIDDAICGFKFFRKETVEYLIKKSSDRKGWFYCIELLLRAERLGIKIKEIPVTWEDDYDTHVNTIKLIKSYLKDIFKLFMEFRINGK